MKELPIGVPLFAREVYITEELQQRPARNPDYAREMLAFHDIASLMVSSPSEVLPRLVDLSMDLCEAVAGGISICEQADQVCRGRHLRGTLEKFTGLTTPRNSSPCGVAMQERSPVLVQRPERVYSWLVEADVSLPECLLVPLSIGADEPIGTIWIVSKDIGHFTESHSRTLTDVAAFAGIALSMVRSEQRLRSALDEQKVLAREMDHRVKNLFAIVQGMVPVAAHRSSTPEEMAKRLSARLHALSGANALLHPVLDAVGKPIQAADLGAVISTVLQPYDHATVASHGPTLQLGQQGTNTIALILYELAANASKHGALGTDLGKLSVNWSRTGDLLRINWIETGGPMLATAPERAGFGSSLVAKAIAYHKGTIAYEWRPTGLELTIMLPESSIAA